MSDRAGIAVYAEGVPVDVRIYRDWETQRLMTEAVTFGALLKDVRTGKEYREAVHRMTDIISLSEYRDERITSEEERQDELYALEILADRTLRVDLDSGMVLGVLPEGIPFRDRADNILQSVRSDPELQNRLSPFVRSMLEYS